MAQGRKETYRAALIAVSGTGFKEMKVLENGR
jgi:hypothetical protein